MCSYDVRNKASIGVVLILRVGLKNCTWHHGTLLVGLSSLSSFGDRLVGLVVKASASRAGDPGFESRLRRDFFGVESYQ